MMRLAVVERNFEVGGVPEEVEDYVAILGSQWHANGLQKPYWTITFLVKVKGKKS